MKFNVTGNVAVIVASWVALATVTHGFLWQDFSSRPKSPTDLPSDPKATSENIQQSNPVPVRSRHAPEINQQARERTQDNPTLSSSNKRSESHESRDQARTRAAGYSSQSQASGHQNQQSRSSRNGYVNSESQYSQDQSPHTEHPSQQDEPDNGSVPPFPGSSRRVYSNRAQQGYNTAKEKCSCSCSNYGGTPVEPTEPGCEWRLVFKAVSGNGRNVYDDWLNGGDLNIEDPEAMTITNPLPYRDGQTLAHWNYEYIKRVKIDLYKEGSRGAYLYFDGTASDSQSWFSQRRLIATTLPDIKAYGTEVFSIEGEDFFDRRFLINDYSDGCSSCGFLMIVDSGSGEICNFEEFAETPYFVYGIHDHSDCYEDWPDADLEIGDRFLIYVKICDLEL